MVLRSVCQVQCEICHVNVKSTVVQIHHLTSFTKMHCTGLCVYTMPVVCVPSVKTKLTSLYAMRTDFVSGG